MTTAALQDDYLWSRGQTRISMSASVVLHVLLLLMIVFAKPPVSAPPVTEITLLDAGDPSPEPAGEPAPVAAAPSAGGVSAGAPDEQRFRRAATHAETAPTPQSDIALDDRLSARVAALQSSSPAAPISAGAVGVPGGMVGAPPAPATGDGGAATLALKRGGMGGGLGHTLALTRGGTGGGAGASLMPAVPAATHAPEAATSRVEETAAHRTLAGAQLLGPVADRPIVHVVTPVYPDWAKKEGVEGAVTLYFVVRADGSVRENVLVQKTAGFEDFDENARSALREWRFAALGAGRTGDQWGTITFQYRLHD